MDSEVKGLIQSITFDSPVVYLVDASSILALELILAAFLLRDVAVGNDGAVFIGAVDAVWVAVANPLPGNAHRAAPLLVGAAFELRLRVTGSSLCKIGIFKCFVVIVAGIN